MLVSFGKRRDWYSRRSGFDTRGQLCSCTLRCRHTAGSGHRVTAGRAATLLSETALPCKQLETVRLRQVALRGYKTMVVARPSKPWSVGSSPTTCSMRSKPTGEAPACQAGPGGSDSHRPLCELEPSGEGLGLQNRRSWVRFPAGSPCARVAATAGSSKARASGSTPDERTISWSHRM